MNQSNTTHILSLLLVLVLSLAAVHIILIPMESTSQFHKILQRNRYNDTINGNDSNISAIKPLNRSDNITNQAPHTNSQQQNFVRLNYNYSTDNETGKRAFFFSSTFVLLFGAWKKSHLWIDTPETNPISKLCDCKYCLFEFPEVSDSKYSISVPRKRRAHESNANHLENAVESAMERTMHGDDYQRHYGIAPTNESKTRHSFNINNWHIRRRKQFIRYVCCSLCLHTLNTFSKAPTLAQTATLITRALICFN